MFDCNESKMNGDFHIAKIGEIVEDAEGVLTSSLENIYLRKSKEIVERTRIHPIEGKQNIEGAMQMKNLFLNRDNQNH